MTEPPSDRLFVTCKPCKHTWIAAYLPMPMNKMASLMKSLRCPRCADKKLFVATKDEALSICQEATP